MTGYVLECGEFSKQIISPDRPASKLAVWAFAPLEKRTKNLFSGGGICGVFSPRMHIAKALNQDDSASSCSGRNE